MRGLILRAGGAWEKFSPVARWRVILGAIALGLLVWLVAADKPWDIQPGPRPKLRHLVGIYTWWGGAFAFSVMAVLALICPWWTAPLRGERSTLNVQRSTLKWFWPLVAVAMILTACFSFPRLGFGLWDDEELCARDSLVGRFRADDKSGAVRFVPLKWEETVFGYETPNNHVLHSIFSRGIHSVALAFGGERALPFSETALRLPAYGFGILSVAALAWFLKDAGFAAAGVAAAFLLALHPWHIRYASEARGYSLILFLVPVLFVFWRRAIIEGSWKWWAGWGGVQFALLYTYPGMLFLLVVLNLLSLPALLFSRDAAGPFRGQSGRWFFVNTCAALLLIVLMLPLIPQARIYFEHEGSRQILLGWSWVRSTLSFMLAGVPWAGSADHVALGNLAREFPFLLKGIIVLAVGLLVIGTVRFARCGFVHACVGLAILATPVLTFLLSRAKGMLIYESYVIYALPGLIALVSVGILLLCRACLRFPGGRILAPLTGLACVAVYGLATQAARQGIVFRPLQQIRESVLACRPVLDYRDPRQKEILTASFCIPPYLYDAHMVRADSADELISLLFQADQTGKPLFLNIGMPWAAREYSPRMWAIFNDDRLFGDRREFLGFDAGLNRLVARYKPGSAKDFDFSALRGEER